MSLNTIAKAEVLKGRLNIAGHTHCDRLGQTSWVAPYRNAFEVVVATEPVMLIQPLSVPPFWMVSHCPGAIHCAPSGFVSGNNGAISLRHGHGNSKSQNAYGHRRMAGRVLDYADPTDRWTNRVGGKTPLGCSPRALNNNKFNF
jgi:hypothetical protein